MFVAGADHDRVALPVGVVEPVGCDVLPPLPVEVPPVPVVPPEPLEVPPETAPVAGLLVAPTEAPELPVAAAALAALEPLLPPHPASRKSPAVNTQNALREEGRFSCIDLCSGSASGYLAALVAKLVPMSEILLQSIDSRPRARRGQLSCRRQRLLIETATGALWPQFALTL